PVLWPLTGEVVGDPARLGETPVVGIKVENTTAARPWVGLNRADVVFVEMVEAGLTRFHAVYQSDVPAVVGPVRSLRPMDAAILGPWNGTLLASGGAGSFIARVESAVALQTQDRGDAGFYRDNQSFGARRAPHNVFVDMETILPSLRPAGEVPQLAEFGESPSTTGGAPANLVSVTYPGARSVWEYSPESGAYLRWDNGTESVETDGTRISARNVLILDVTTRDTGALDAARNPVPETILSGSGNLHMFMGGQVVQGTWSKGGDKEPFVLTTASGEPLVLSPGSSWIELLPERGQANWE
ncbi:MAG TPA: DUF3048 domain-containing protein, partial [Actinomycetaceae bacterium]|nr:DUF3048 domain-containing protein [Actinomycetaceae bacterium]